MNKVDSLKRAYNALKKYSKRSAIAKRVEKQMYNVVIANGCWNKLNSLVDELVKKYSK